MFKRLFAVLVVFYILFSLSGCTEQSDGLISNDSQDKPNTVSPINPFETNDIPESDSEIEKTGNQAETSSHDTSKRPLEKSASGKTPEMKKPESSTSSVSEKKGNPAKNTEGIIHASSVMLSFCSYESINEKTPYILGSPVYKVLYSGKRVQIGDSLILSIGASPFNHTDQIYVEVSNGLEYNLSGNLLRIAVKQDGNYGVGRVTVYAVADNGSISASAVYSFVVDSARDPFADAATVLADYIRIKGMQFTSFSEGYTAADPTKSITHYAGAPAWDDMIDKSNSAWLKQCFNLIDQYKSMGFSKVNFIITDISVGLSAAI